MSNPKVHLMASPMKHLSVSIAVVKTGTNVLAVHCHQTSDGQYVGVGIFPEASAFKQA